MTATNATITPSDELAIALGSLEDCRHVKPSLLNIRLVAVVEALARVRQEDAAELAMWRREAARQAKVCDLLAGRVRMLEGLVGPEGDGR